MANDWNIDSLRDDAQYGVIDDLRISDMRKTWKGFLGGQTDVTVTDKYRGKRVYPGGKPLIFCTNDDPREEDHLSAGDVRWLNGNCVFFHLDRPLWQKNN